MKNKVTKPQAARSLTATLAIAFLALSVVLLFIASSLQTFSNIATQQEAVASKLQLYAQGASQSVSSFIQDKFSTLTTAVHLTNLTSVSPTEQRQILEGLLGRDMAFRQLVLFNVQDQEQARASRLSKAAAGQLPDRLTGEALTQIKQGKNYIGPVYIDPNSSEPQVLMAIPATDALGNSQGTLAAEVNLKFMWDLVDQLKVGERGVAYVVDRQGNLLAFNDTARVLRGENVANLDVVRKFTSGPSSVPTRILNLSTGIQGTLVVAANAPLGTPDWAVIAELPSDEAYRVVSQNGIASAVILVIMSALAGLLGVYLARRLAVPLVNLTGTATRIAGGEMGLQATVGGTREVASLATAFNSMTQQLRSLISGLEQRVAERTAELSKASESLGHRVNQLQAGAEVSRAATTITDPDQLIPRVVELIQQRFDFYYVGLFLVDADGRYAVLQHGGGSGSAREAGRVMKERGHRLEVGSQSMVGWACANKQARIALDVGQDAVRFANPLLPDTRSEMALPLRAGERVIGALDVQSTQAAAFDESDIAALQGMADQVTVALENARLFQQTQAALKELEMTNRLVTREGWQAYLERKTIRRAEFPAASEPDQGPQTEPLTMPLELRGQSLGRLTLRREGSRAWSPDEVQVIEAIALQTALAADNARLIEQTQIALHESEALYQAASEISGATDLQAICQHVTSYINDLVLADRTTMFLVDRDRKRILFSTGSGNIGDDLQMTYTELTSGISGRVLHSGQPVLSLSADDGIEPEETRERRRQSGIGALIIVPLNIKGQVFGTVTAINRRNQPEFTQHDVELLTAFAAQAATAIDNVRLLAETQHRAEREALIRQITTRIRAAGDIQGVLETTANELARSMGVSRSIVRLTTGDGA